jgi:hypothetical protein
MMLGEALARIPVVIVAGIFGRQSFRATHGEQQGDRDYAPRPPIAGPNHLLRQRCDEVYGAPHKSWETPAFPHVSAST